MLPALPSSRGGLSRDAASPNRRAGCGGRRGSRQIRARRPRQQRRGREGERQWPPERSPRLRRLRGARAAAGAMLEELECGAPGARGAAAAMDCKDRPAFPVKKLIQARLPFKRLNLVPKEKSEDASDDTRSPEGAPAQGRVPHLETSLDNLENSCHMGSDIDFNPKLVNGKGPLDNFLRSTVKTSIDQTTVITDLTEDSSDRLDGVEALSKLKSAASPSEEAVSGAGEEAGGEGGLPEASLKDEPTCPEETLSDIPCKAEEEGAGSRGAERSGEGQEGSLQSCPELTGGLRTCSEKDQDGWSEARGILFKGKVPVVVLEDILAAKPPRTKSPPTPPADQGLPSDSEMLESGPEEDSVLSHSSGGSSSPTSSPEGQSAPKRHPRSPGPFPTSTPIRRITKKLVKASAEKDKLRLQRDRERLGKQLKLRAEKEEKEKLKEEAKRAREEAKKKKEEEKELKEKERREKREKDEKEKAEKQRLKEERRKERQEALEAKLEEKRKKEEEKRLREEEKRIKAEKAEITRFFQKPKTPQAPKTLAGSCGKFAPFEIKEHMVLAPRFRTAFDQDLCDQLDQLLRQQNGEFSFLKDLKGRQPLRSGPTVVSNRNTDTCNSDVVIVESGKVDGVPERKKFGRMKLLQFSENHRPAYWGTWNKKTTVIHPRDPWALDRLLDYEVDSDEEWEEEEPGESLSHSEGDDDDEVGDDEDEDDGFFVPHGYLSEDEGVTEECADPENHKVRQKLKAKEWDEFLAKGKRFRVLQPVKIGCVWAADKDGGADLKVLQQFTACLLETVPSEEEQTPKASKREKRDQQILAQLLPLLHGNVNGSKVIIREFQECCRRGLLGKDTGSPDSSSASPPSPGSSRPQTPTSSEDAAVPSKARLKRIISENSVYEKRPDFRMCWYVHPQVLKSFDQEHLPVPCQWSYVTVVPSATREDSGSIPAAGPGQGTPMSLKRKSAGSMCITQFMKKRRHDGQVGAGDLDGFQADTEEEEEEDGDCVILDISDVGEAQAPCGTASGAGGSVGMDSSESPPPASSLGPC
ncbi:chromatin assembly factor 1 subunit A isoform X2 [Prionailurus bengalensis]|uniref:chromatin assembly factor 1 subunit A isoform X2 n=1 Tax=Prionailurus bengalensis TaxID=37029 RepID=UPI001CA7C6DA|nr:chromatin assembly factor 1 subunit A isoform X2 [Prionailurus bengalensis]